MPDLNQLKDAILRGDAKSAIAVTKEAIAEKVDPLELVTQYMVPAMDEVGRRFECQEYFVPELLIAARAMKGALELIRPLLAAKGVVSTGTVVIGTVRGDLHDIGKNLVASMLEGAGFDVYDLGTDVTPQKFLTEAKAKKAQIIALSALLTTTMTSMKTIIEEFKAQGVRDQFKFIIGGAPVTQEYATQIGADGYSENANGAVALARKLIVA
ncbi:MAG TPA: corrinoid protein [Acidobacteriota bacterium]|nr:corrinoid protein [Acidobacteriota bacterium]